MLLLPVLLTYLFSLMHLNALQNVVVTLYFTCSAAAVLLYIGTVSPSEQRPEDLFLFQPWAKISRCPKGHVCFGGLHNKFIGYTSQPLEMLMDPYSYVTLTLDLPLFYLGSQTAGSLGRRLKEWQAASAAP